MQAAPSPAVLDLQGGAIGELTGKTLGIAHGLLAFLLVLGLVRELLRGPGQRRHYLAVVWRSLLVLGLLQGYGFLAGSVVKQCTALAGVLAPAESVEALLEKYKTGIRETFGSADSSVATPAPDDTRPGGIGGVLFDAVLALVLLVAQAVQWVFTQLSRLLIGLFYALGPLALVFHVLGLDVPGRWFRNLVTVSCWPAVSALLLHLAASVLTRTELDRRGERLRRHCLVSPPLRHGLRHPAHRLLAGGRRGEPRVRGGVGGHGRGHGGGGWWRPRCGGPRCRGSRGRRGAARGSRRLPCGRRPSRNVPASGWDTATSANLDRGARTVTSPSSPPPRPWLPNVAGTHRSPPAIWAAMVQQGRWKSWALVLAFGLCALEALVALRLASRPPDVVLIAPDGQSTYVNPSVAGQALLRFLREQRQLPSDVTVLHFTREFARRFFALDAGTAETSFQEALAMMAPGLRGPIAQEGAETKLLEGIRASRTRVALTFEAVDLLEQTEGAVRVRLVLGRRTESLDVGKRLSEDRLEVDLLEWIVPRTPAHPDGLVVGQLTSRALSPDAPAQPGSTPSVRHGP